jgi:hypothetical protein
LAVAIVTASGTSMPGVPPCARADLSRTESAQPLLRHQIALDEGLEPAAPEPKPISMRLAALPSSIVMKKP